MTARLLEYTRGVQKTSDRLKGREGFERYYRLLYPKRWHELSEALRAPVKQVARLNGFCDDRWLSDNLPRRVSAVPGCVSPPGADPPPRDRAGLRTYYAMDAASVVASLALAVAPGQRVLDMCAAPGGKTLILAEALAGGDPAQWSWELVANDRSAARRRRMKRVLADYLPTSILARVRVTGHDATRWGLHERNAYDAILIDAPCSSERHVIGDDAALRNWSTTRVDRLAITQFAMLAAALAALKPGGRIVYCTCALTPAENDEVIARLLESPRHSATLQKLSAPLGEATQYGWRILPDVTGFGPIYFAGITKSLTA